MGARMAAENFNEKLETLLQPFEGRDSLRCWIMDFSALLPTTAPPLVEV